MPEDPDALTAAEQVFVDALHDTLDTIPTSIHGRRTGWVDGNSDEIAPALLATGWATPAEAERLRAIEALCGVPVVECHWLAGYPKHGDES